MRKTYIHPQILTEEIRLTNIIAASVVSESADSNREVLSKGYTPLDDCNFDD